AWKTQLGAEVLLADRAGQEPPKVSADELLKALDPAVRQLERRFGRLDVKYGDVFRVRRAGGSKTWPVGGGSVPGLATPRAISFTPGEGGKVYLGRGGQTSTQVAQLSKPPRSWTLVPLGQSDHPQSKHWDDQAEKLFSPGKLKPTYFLNKQELLKHVESKKVLHRPVD